MILVDTSVWVDHLCQGEPQLAAALERLEVAIHPWVIGELACNHLRQRQQVLQLLAMLPSLPGPSIRSCCGSSPTSWRWE